MLKQIFLKNNESSYLFIKSISDKQILKNTFVSKNVQFYKKKIQFYGIHATDSKSKKLFRNKYLESKDTDNNEQSQQQDVDTTTTPATTTTTSTPTTTPTTKEEILKDKIENLNKEGIRFKINNSLSTEHMLKRIDKFEDRKLQRERSLQENKELKQKHPFGYEETLESFKKLYISKKYEKILKQYFFSIKKFTVEINRLVIETLKQSRLANGKVSQNTIVEVLLRMAITKHPFNETIEFLKHMGEFGSRTFSRLYIQSSEPHQVIYLYDLINYYDQGKYEPSSMLGSSDSTPKIVSSSSSSRGGNGNSTLWSKLISPGDKFHSKIIRSLITVSRHEEAIEQYNTVDPLNLTGEIIQHIASGFIEMGFIEKAKLIMFENFHLRRDENYIVSAIELSLAIGDPELASLLLLNTPNYLKIKNYPPEIMQALILELGLHKKYNLLIEMYERDIFKRFGLNEHEIPQLLYNAFSNCDPQNEEHTALQKKFYQEIIYNRQNNAIQKILSLSKDDRPHTFDIEKNKNIPIHKRLIQINYKHLSFLTDKEKEFYQLDNNSNNNNESLELQIQKRLDKEDEQSEVIIPKKILFDHQTNQKDDNGNVDEIVDNLISKFQKLNNENNELINNNNNNEQQQPEVKRLKLRKTTKKTN